jgi:hypothetical protein
MTSRLSFQIRVQQTEGTVRLVEGALHAVEARLLLLEAGVCRMEDVCGRQPRTLRYVTAHPDLQFVSATATENKSATIMLECAPPSVLLLKFILGGATLDGIRSNKSA